MNKWSLLLFSVLGLLLSTTSELNFVDGRLECCDRSSRPLLSDTSLSIYETDCPYRTFTEVSQLISPKRDIRHDVRNDELRRTSDSRRRQFRGRRFSSDERFRVSNNIVFDLDDSTLSNTRDRKVPEENNDLYLRRNLKSFSRDNFRENHVHRSRARNNDFLGNKMERNSQERRINMEEKLSEIRDNRFRHNDRNQERFNRRTFVIKTYITPNQRENIDRTMLSFIQKNEGKRDVERNNLDITTRQRLFRDTRLTDLSRNSDRRFKKDNSNSNERHFTMQSVSKIGILRHKNNPDYLRLSVRDDSIVKMSERESFTNVRRNINTMSAYRRSYDEDISEEMVPGAPSRPRTIQRESEGSRNRIHDDTRQMDSGVQKRIYKEHYLTRGLPRQNSNINRLQEIHQAKLYKDINIKDGEEISNVLFVRIERASVQSRNRKNRENNREPRLNEEYTAKRITPKNTKTVAEKQTASSNINRRSEANRHSVLEARERENSRFRLNHENKNIIKQSRNSHNEDMLRELRNSQRRLIQSNAMGQETNNIMQNYENENDFQGFLVRTDNYRELVNRLGREKLSRIGKPGSQIRIVQRETENKKHTRAIKIQENRKQEDYKFNKRLVSNTNRNVEKQRSRTYLEKSDKEEFRNSLVRETERAFDKNRIRQVRDKHEHRREYQLEVESTVERVLSRIDRNTNNVAERGFLSIRSSIGNNRLYRITQNAATVLKRRDNDEARYRSTHENKRIVDQRRTRDMLEVREDNLSNERLTQRNLASRSGMNNDVLNNNRRSYNDENNPRVLLTIKKSERERFSSANKRSSYLITSQTEHENRMHNDYRQRTNIQEIRSRKEHNANRGLARQDSDTNRIIEDRRAKTPNEKLNTRNILATGNKRSLDNSRVSRQRDSREYRVNDNVNAEPVLVRNIEKNMETRDSKIRSEFDANHLSQKTKRTLILLQLREKKVASLIRLNKQDLEQNENEIIRNKQFTRIEDHSRDTRIAQIPHVLRKINVRSNTRVTHDKVATRYVETEVEFYNSHETHRERRTERDIRNIARHGLSINNRDVNRKLEYIRHVRSHNGPENSAHRENKNNARISERENNRRVARQDKERNIRDNDLQILNKESRITKTRRTNEEREIGTATSNIRFFPIEHKAQSDNQIFKINLQYIIYLLQGLYILGILTKFTENFNGIHKRTRFSNWFPLFSNLKVN